MNRLACLFLITFAAIVLTASCSKADNADEADTSAQSGPTGSALPAIDYTPEPYVKLTHPEWSRDAVIYQLNTRQFSPEGTFAAAQVQLPRLKQLGVDIIWLMPIHPIGEVNRKGTLGSPYSVKDYYGVNPEFGTLDDFKAFLKAAHDLDMHVIIDWVANHTAWDNPIVTEHPDWYEQDWKGDFHPTPWWDWSDIIDLNYDAAPLRDYMAKAMRYWVEEVGVDGFRCDVAGYVPLDFWEKLRADLDRIRPVFMLGEWESRDIHARAFDASYAWTWNNAVHDIAQGKADVGALFGYYSGNESAWPHDAMRMTYVSNHDQNAWEATQFGRFGEALEAAIVLSVVGEGIPLIYNGQEAGNEKKLEFFEKDPIVWREHPIGDLYRALFSLKHQTRALWNGKDGARMISIVNSVPSKVLSFVRFGDADGIFCLINFTGEPQTLTFTDALHHGLYRDAFSEQGFEFSPDSAVTLEPWGYRVMVRQ